MSRLLAWPVSVTISPATLLEPLTAATPYIRSPDTARRPCRTSARSSAPYLAWRSSGMKPMSMPVETEPPSDTSALTDDAHRYGPIATCQPRSTGGGAGGTSCGAPRIATGLPRIDCVAGVPRLERDLLGLGRRHRRIVADLDRVGRVIGGRRRDLDRPPGLLVTARRARRRCLRGGPAGDETESDDEAPGE